MMERKREICNNTIIREVAQELGLSISVVKDIVSTQSKLTIKVIESNSFDSIRWPYLGIFKAKTKAVQVINHLKGLSKDQKEDFRRAIISGKVKVVPREKGDWEDEWRKKLIEERNRKTIRQWKKEN